MANKTGLNARETKEVYNKYNVGIINKMRVEKKLPKLNDTNIKWYNSVENFVNKRYAGSRKLAIVLITLHLTPSQVDTLNVSSSGDSMLNNILNKKYGDKELSITDAITNENANMSDSLEIAKLIDEGYDYLTAKEIVEEGKKRNVYVRELKLKGVRG